MKPIQTAYIKCDLDKRICLVKETENFPGEYRVLFTIPKGIYHHWQYLKKECLIFQGEK